MAGKPTTPGMTQQEEISLLKDKFLSYYQELPIKKAGADFIGRSLDTINNWEKEDPDFADRVLKAKAEYARKHGKGRPDNLLPKLYEDFQPKQSDIVIPTAVVINYVNPSDRLPSDSEAGPSLALPSGQSDN